ncbi:MAG: amidohydrolase family protein [Gemmatimonadetes bacterium]|nr:amidohydrolase family protein [Gemmatimonadota bacterium]
MTRWRAFLISIVLLSMAALGSRLPLWPSDQSRVLAFVGATLVDGTGAVPVPDAVVIVRDGLISCAGPRARCAIPRGEKIVDVRGRWIVPGLIDAHVHFSQTGWVDGRPDAVDLRDRFPYARVVASLEAGPGRFFRTYLCSGVTAVFDVGGYPWTWGLRRRAEQDEVAPRIAAAGPLLSTIDFWLNLPAERQFITMADDSTVRSAVRVHAAFRSDAVKVWYIFPPQPPDTPRIQALLRAASEEARARGLPLIVHATRLWEAKDAIRAGARVLVHSVFDDPVDDEFLRLAKENDVIYTPTITVIEGYRDVYLGTLDGSRYPLDCVDSRTRLFARPDAVPRDRISERTVERARTFFPQRVATAMANARRAHEAGVTIAVGTDAGNPGTFHGPSIYREMELLQEAGLAPMDVLVAATRNAARAMGRGGEIGTIESGKRADFVILDADPIADIRNVRRVHSVVRGGVVHSRGSLLP